MIYNFNLPRNCGKTYYEMNKRLDEREQEIEELNNRIEELNNRIEKAKHFIDQVLGYHLNDYKQLDKDVNELYGILIGKGEDKE